jgi:hypothetical protein
MYIKIDIYLYKNKRHYLITSGKSFFFFENRYSIVSLFSSRLIVLVFVYTLCVRKPIKWKKNIFEDKISEKKLPLIREIIKHPNIIIKSTIEKPRIGKKMRNFIVCFFFDNWVGDNNRFSLRIVFIVVVVTIPFKQS